MAFPRCQMECETTCVTKWPRRRRTIQPVSLISYLLSALLLGTLPTRSPAGETATATAPPITAAVFTPDGMRVVVGSQAGIEVRSWPELKLVRKLQTTLPNVHDLAFSTSGKQLLAAGGAPGEAGIVEWYAADGQKPTRREQVNDDLIYSVCSSADQRVAAGGGDALVQIFDASGKLERTLAGHSHPVLATVFLPDGKTLVSAGVDQTLRVWDVASGETKRTLAIHTAAVLGLAVRPSAEPLPRPYLASISRDRSVRLWQPTIGRMVRFARLVQVPLSLAWTPDGKQMVVGCDDGHLRVVDPDTVKVVAEYPALSGWVHTLAAHPTRREVLAGGTGGALKRVVLAD